MVLILLFMSEFLLGIINLKKEKHLKKISEQLMQLACILKDGEIFA